MQDPIPVKADSGREYHVLKLSIGNVNELVSALIGNQVDLVLGIPRSFLKFAVKGDWTINDEDDFETVAEIVEVFERVNPSIEGRMSRMFLIK